jgi:hypothetical protein
VVAIYLKSIHPAFLRYVLTYPEVKKKNPDDRKGSQLFLTSSLLSVFHSTFKASPENFLRGSFPEQEKRQSEETRKEKISISSR